MSDFFAQLWVAFVPLFVAMNVIGVVPLFIGMTEDLNPSEKQTLIRNACLAVLVVSIIFIFTGTLLFSFMGISADDFRVGGGIILLVISIVDLVFKQEKRRDATNKDVGVGIVPVGIPLIMGPAALTYLLVIVDRYGYFVTIANLILNLGIVYFCFSRSSLIVKILSPGGIKAFSKIASLFLAAIAVMMIRVGIQNIITSF